ncbi:MAG TPA: AzlC family ABC transporter permease [Nocardioides sp.]|nr:AzlC family ABC transporter permease [Nocardioides sp.]
MSFRHDFTAGMRTAAGAAAATFVLGVTFGAAAAEAGWGWAAPLAFSAFAFSGSAQFSLLTTLSAGSVVAAVASATLINARYLVMGVALNDSLRGGRLRRALQAQALVDASFVVAHRGGGRFDYARLLGATLPQWSCWLAGTLTGVLLRPDAALLERVGADVVFPAFFLLLALDEVRTRTAAAAALGGAVIAGGLLLVTQPGYALLAATAAALLGALPGPSQGLAGDGAGELA